MQRRGMAPARPVAVDMDTKTQPLQERSRQTFEAILRAGGVLLQEVGVEKFSTNLVCQRAHVTPPALYRYFPNKYALLKELAHRLMEAQDEAVYEWIDRGGLEGSTEDEIVARNREVIRRVIDVTAAFPGGLWILRAMRAVPLMRDVRLKSTETVVEQVLVSLTRQYPRTAPERLRRAAWLTTETSNAVIEMVLEGAMPDSDAILTEACVMIARYYVGFG